MPTLDLEALKAFVKTARQNDLPNSFVFAFTAILWPACLLLWSRRRVNSIPGLDVHVSAGVMVLGGKNHPALDIEFINHTGSVAYITAPHLRRCTSLFKPSSLAGRDVARGAYFLQFLDGAGGFSLREVTLQTNAAGATSLALDAAASSELLTFSAPWYRRVVSWPRFFVIEYTALIGTKRYAVSTVF